MIDQDSQTHGRARTTFASEADIDEFAAALARFERGEMSPAEWRVYRLARGTYGQRQADDAQMIRVKIPQGLLTAPQVRAIATAAETWSRGFAHITTRQNVQVHFVRLQDVEPAMRGLASAGLTTREACGNSVRNVTTCVLAGVSGSELFDVTPYAEALTRHFLRHPLGAALPRKFKIAFEGCREDHVMAAINDIAWRAQVHEGRRGFRVLVGGGTSTMAVTARELVGFLPAARMLELAEAIVRVFHARGDYEHKARNRMKFLIKSMGWDQFRAEVLRVLNEVEQAGGIALPFDPADPPAETAPDWTKPAPPAMEEITGVVAGADVRGPGLRPVPVPIQPSPDRAGFTAWLATNVRRQRQTGYSVATATVPLGDLSGAQWRVVARLAEAFGDGAIRLTPAQNLVFRWVADADIEPLYERLAAAGLGLAGADTVADVTSCPGAESCKLAVTQSRGLGQAIALHLRTMPDLLHAAAAINVKVSGCPNGCGQHHIASVGFQGSLRKVDGRAAPQYFVMVGGGVGGDAASFGRLVAKIPARRAPIALERLAWLYARERALDDTPASFFARADRGRLSSLLADLEVLTADTATADDFVDFAETGPFRPDMQEGECAV
jgi:sulfite reductase (NADPH) hemoprotein beta-component